MPDDDWQSLLRATIPLASERKNTLYFCAGLRHLWDWVYDHRSRTAVEVAERFVDGLATEEELGYAAYYAEIPGWGYGNGREPENRVTDDGEIIRYEEVRDDFANSLIQELLDSGLLTIGVLRQGGKVSNTETLERLRRLAQIAEYNTLGTWDGKRESMLADVANVPNWPGTWLIHEIYGNPSSIKPINPDWLAWDAGTVRSIAERIYEERAFDRLPILADALQEAGCEHEAILGHLRGPGEHFLGCWALDWVLGKS